MNWGSITRQSEAFALQHLDLGHSYRWYAQETWCVAGDTPQKPPVTKIECECGEAWYRWEHPR